MVLSELVPSAISPPEVIADAAQHWGQEDDITVLTVTRTKNTGGGHRMKKTAPFAVLFILFACAGVHAQSAPTNTVPVTLGQSVVALYGPWKFHIGDNPKWADPNFDDSDWETVDSDAHSANYASRGADSGLCLRVGGAWAPGVCGICLVPHEGAHQRSQRPADAAFSGVVRRRISVLCQWPPDRLLWRFQRRAPGAL